MRLGWVTCEFIYDLSLAYVQKAGRWTAAAEILGIRFISFPSSAARVGQRWGKHKTLNKGGKWEAQLLADK